MEIETQVQGLSVVGKAFCFAHLFCSVICLPVTFTSQFKTICHGYFDTKCTCSCRASVIPCVCHWLFSLQWSPMFFWCFCSRKILVLCVLFGFWTQELYWILYFRLWLFKFWGDFFYSDCGNDPHLLIKIKVDSCWK